MSKLQEIVDRVIKILPDDFKEVKLVIDTERKDNAYAEITKDGEMSLVFGEDFAKRDEEELAVIVTHELAHLILTHDLFVSNSSKENDVELEWRVMERDADILGMFLLKQAGFDISNIVKTVRTLLKGAKDFTYHPHPSNRIDNIKAALKIYN
jgi:predicted Zn-dependent protease